MKCQQCGGPTIGDNLICDECRYLDEFDNADERPEPEENWIGELRKIGLEPKERLRDTDEHWSYHF
jgi:hypothetical protein